MTNKALFEKIAFAGKSMTLKQSVIDNIDRILSCGGFLDADNHKQSISPYSKKRDPGVTDCLFRHRIKSIVEQSAMTNEQRRYYKDSIAKVLLRFEPRLRNVTVSNIVSRGVKSSCRLKIELIDFEFEQDFIFS